MSGRAESENVSRASKDVPCWSHSPKMAAVYTAAVAPTRPLAVTRLCGSAPFNNEFELAGNVMCAHAERPATASFAQICSKMNVLQHQARGLAAPHLEQPVDPAHWELQAGPG